MSTKRNKCSAKDVYDILCSKIGSKNPFDVNETFVFAFDLAKKYIKVGEDIDAFHIHFSKKFFDVFDKFSRAEFAQKYVSNNNDVTHYFWARFLCDVTAYSMDRINEEQFCSEIFENYFPNKNNSPNKDKFDEFKTELQQKIKNTENKDNQNEQQNNFWNLITPEEQKLIDKNKDIESLKSRILFDMQQNNIFTDAKNIDELRKKYLNNDPKFNKLLNAWFNIVGSGKKNFTFEEKLQYSIDYLKLCNEFVRIYKYEQDKNVNVLDDFIECWEKYYNEMEGQPTGKDVTDPFLDITYIFRQHFSPFYINDLEENIKRVLLYPRNENLDGVSLQLWIKVLKNFKLRWGCSEFDFEDFFLFSKMTVAFAHATQTIQMLNQNVEEIIDCCNTLPTYRGYKKINEEVMKSLVELAFNSLNEGIPADELSDLCFIYDCVCKNITNEIDASCKATYTLAVYAKRYNKTLQEFSDVLESIYAYKRLSNEFISELKFTNFNEIEEILENILQKNVNVSLNYLGDFERQLKEIIKKPDRPKTLLDCELAAIEAISQK